MPNTVTFPNGHIYTDDRDGTTGLDGGGHRDRFIPCVSDIVALAAGLASGLGLYSVSGATSKTLVINDCKGSSIDNVGQSASCDLQLPTAFEGANFIMIVGQTTASPWRIRAGATDKIYLNGVAGLDNGYVGITTPVVGSFLSVFAFKTDVSSYDWMAIVGNGSFGVI